MGRVTFLYMGLSIWGDAHRLSFWKPLLDIIRRRLSGWQSKFLSFRGRPIILKFVLTSLLVYAFSFFKAPAGIISSLEYLLIFLFFILDC